MCSHSCGSYAVRCYFVAITEIICLFKLIYFFVLFRCLFNSSWFKSIRVGSYDALNSALQMNSFSAFNTSEAQTELYVSFTTLIRIKLTQFTWNLKFAARFLFNLFTLHCSARLSTVVVCYVALYYFFRFYDSI